MGGHCFSDMLYSSISYRQKYALLTVTEPQFLYKDEYAL
jgi:hypothetical protein